MELLVQGFLHVFWVAENFTWERGLNLHHWQTVLELVHKVKLKEIWEQICHALMTPYPQLWGHSGCCECKLLYLICWELNHACCSQNLPVEGMNRQQTDAVHLPCKCILSVWSRMFPLGQGYSFHFVLGVERHFSLTSSWALSKHHDTVSKVFILILVKAFDLSNEASNPVFPSDW